MVPEASADSVGIGDFALRVFVVREQLEWDEAALLAVATPSPLASCSASAL